MVDAAKACISLSIFDYALPCIILAVSAPASFAVVHGRTSHSRSQMEDSVITIMQLGVWSIWDDFILGIVDVLLGGRPNVCVGLPAPAYAAAPTWDWYKRSICRSSGRRDSGYLDTAVYKMLIFSIYSA